MNYEKINKIKAKKLFNSGETVYLSNGSLGGSKLEIKKGDFFYHGEFINDFDEIVSDFKSYNKQIYYFIKPKFGKGGGIEKENAEMVLNNNKQISHHTKELASAVKGKKVPAWVVAKVNRSASDLSDATHYLDGSKFKNGGEVGYSKKDRVIDYYYQNDVFDDYETYDLSEEDLNNENKVIKSIIKYHKLNKPENVNERFEVLFGEDEMAKGGYVFKGDKYEYVPTKFTYTIGGL